MQANPIGDLIAKLRQDANLTQEELAAKIEKSPRVGQYYEAGCWFAPKSNLAENISVEHCETSAHIFDLKSTDPAVTGPQRGGWVIKKANGEPLGGVYWTVDVTYW